MIRTKNMAISLIAVVAVAAAVAAPAMAYTSPNAALNSGTEQPTGSDFQGSVNAVLSERSEVGGSPTEVSSPNAILGASNGGEVAASPADDGSGGFDWGSAGIGAGAVLGVMLVGLGAFVLTRRRHEPTVQPS